MQAYCVKCHRKVSIIDGREKLNQRGIKYIQGRCPVCSVKVNKIIGK